MLYSQHLAWRQHQQLGPKHQKPLWGNYWTANPTHCHCKFKSWCSPKGSTTLGSHQHLGVCSRVLLQHNGCLSFGQRTYQQTIPMCQSMMLFWVAWHVLGLLWQWGARVCSSGWLLQLSILSWGGWHQWFIKMVCLIMFARLTGALYNGSMCTTWMIGWLFQQNLFWLISMVQWDGPKQGNHGH